MSTSINWIVETGLQNFSSQMTSVNNYTIHFRKKYTNSIQTCPKKLKRREHSRTYFTRPIFPQKQNQAKASLRRYVQVFFINIDAKMHNNILENLIQQYVKKCNNMMAKWSLAQLYKIYWTLQNLGLSPTPTDTT